MTFFFLVVGLEAKRELDLGELRERRRLAIPAIAALGGMAVPVAIYLAFNAGGQRPTAGEPRCRPTRPSRSACWRSWPACDTPARVPAELAVVDDLVALLVIAIVYTEHVELDAAAGRTRAVRASCRAALRPVRVAPPGAARARRGALGGAAGVGHRPGRLRPRRRARHDRLHAGARRPRARDRADALVPRAADARARPLGPGRDRVGDVGQRAAPVPPAPVDQLRDRAALRAREPGHPPRRAAAARRGHLADHARDHLRLRGRQAGGHLAGGLARHRARGCPGCGCRSAGR